MDRSARVKTIACDDDIAHGIAYLTARDPRLAAIHRITGQPGLRLKQPGIAALLFMITEQMISLKAAAAIWQRVEAALAPFDPRELATLDEQTYRACGLSGPKLNTMRALAAAISAGTLDLDRLDIMSDSEAIAHLTAVKGIGEWTAQVYLLSCHGRPDIWPARDLALQAAARAAFELPARPDHRQMNRLAQDWRPARAIAARLLWAYYRHMNGLPPA